jgi:Fe-S-cluster-containing dehydrogenase component
VNRIGRRRLLRTAVGLSAAWLVSGLARRASAAERFVREFPWIRRRPYWGYAIDLAKCIGCGKCVEACKNENDVPRQPFYFRTWVERYVVRRNGGVEVESPNGGMDGFSAPDGSATILKTFFIPKMCNHCDTSPCIQVCPVGASYLTPDGTVQVDKKYCIGCRYCIQACPYGSRFFNPYTRTADKCTLCYHRITRGLRPACVEACPTGTRIFGDLSDPGSPVSRFIAQNRVQVLKPEMGTRPKLVYKGLDREVR